MDQLKSATETAQTSFKKQSNSINPNLLTALNFDEAPLKDNEREGLPSTE